MTVERKDTILLLGGTGDAVSLVDDLSPFIAKHGSLLLVSVVSENAADKYRKNFIPVRAGAMNCDQLRNLVNEKNISVIIDATHPFASEVSRNAMSTAGEVKIEYIRYERPGIEINHDSGYAVPDFIIPDENDEVFFVADHEEAARLAISLQKKLNRNLTVMLTTGAKSLELYSREFQSCGGISTVVRLLPTLENIQLCAIQNISQSNIIAMEGPFGRELNKQLFLKYGIDVMISKESGAAGSTDEKILAARDLHIKSIIVNRPEIHYRNLCRSFDEVKNKLAELLRN